jgi:hypothetical protein
MQYTIWLYSHLSKTGTVQGLRGARRLSSRCDALIGNCISAANFLGSSLPLARGVGGMAGHSRAPSSLATYPCRQGVLSQRQKALGNELDRGPFEAPISRLEMCCLRKDGEGGNPDQHVPPEYSVPAVTTFTARDQPVTPRSGLRARQRQPETVTCDQTGKGMRSCCQKAIGQAPVSGNRARARPQRNLRERKTVGNGLDGRHLAGTMLAVVDGCPRRDGQTGNLD